MENQLFNAHNFFFKKLKLELMYRFYTEFLIVKNHYSALLFEN